MTQARRRENAGFHGRSATPPRTITLSILPLADSSFRRRRFGRGQRADHAGADRGDPLARQLVGALVLGVAGMALHPMPFDVMGLECLVEPLPEIDVLDRLLVGGAPAVALPAVDP